MSEAATAPPLLEAESITKRYGSAVALHPTSLVLPAGERTMLIGPSGSGKSTLLRVMMGLVRPDGGRVRFADTELTPATVLSIRRRIGYVVQEGGLFPHLTAEENVALMARHLGWDETRIAARLKDLLALTRLSADLLGRYPAELSGGQRQRVGMMRALMMDPDLLVLDEPLGALDPLVRRELQDDLLAIFRSLEKTVLMVTHDLDEAAFFGDRLVLLNDGRVVQMGRYDELAQAPADPFVTRFLTAQRRRVTDGGAA